MEIIKKIGITLLIFAITLLGLSLLFFPGILTALTGNAWFYLIYLGYIFIFIAFFVFTF